VRCSGLFSGSLSSDRGSSWPRVEVSSRVSDCISHCKPIPLYLLLLLLVLNWSHGIYCCTRVSASTWPSKIIYNILDLLGELVKLILIATDHCRETHLFSCRCCCVEKAEKSISCIIYWRILSVGIQRQVAHGTFGIIAADL